MVLREGTTRIEFIMKLHAIARRLHANPDSANTPADVLWERVAAEATRGGGRGFEPEVEDITAYVRNLSGGISNPVYLNRFRDFVQTVKLERQIPAEMYGALGRATIQGVNQAPNYRTGMLMAMAGASDAFAQGAVQNLFHTNDVQQIQDKFAEFVLQAESMIARSDALLVEQGLADQESAKILQYLFIIRLVHHVQRKPDKSRGVFATMRDIGNDFISGLNDAFGRSIESPWPSAKASAKAAKAPPKAKAKASAKASAIGHGVAEFAGNEVRNNVDLVRSLGFVDGATIVRREDKRREVMQIVAITLDYACVQSGPLQMKIPHAQLLGKKWLLSEAEAEPQYVDDWLNLANPVECIDHVIVMRQSIILRAITDLHNQEAGCLATLRICKGPPKLKGVTVTTACKKGAIVLAPLVTAVAFRSAKEKLPDLAIDLDICVEDPRGAKEPLKASLKQ